ncbi:MAG TPA: RES domain-containing protein [Candidatus Moranbacteria bacterium]|nr:RES domain-containing protein [Candidatus Moranbacteria bacterium]
MNCCPNCFTHTFLKDFIKKSSKQNGKCSFCSSKRIFPLCSPTSLIDLFQPLFDLYTEERGGRFLNELLQYDWNIFSKYINKKKTLKLISKIAGKKELNSKRFISTLVLNKAFIDKWDAFTNELKHENRFFPKNAIDTSQLSELFDYLIMSKEQSPKYVFRARINHQSIALPITEMGTPPLDKSKDGRANPKGISYFYGTSDEKTAIAEIRPYKSENVCVAKFKVNKRISLIDLRDPKSTISPFGLDDDSLSLLYQDHMPFLGHLGDALSKPVLPYKKELEYLPTQYLCELVKDHNFNGIVFKSSLEQGDNYVIFDDSFLTGTKVETFIVSDTPVKSVKVTRKK